MIEDFSKSRSPPTFKLSGREVIEVFLKSRFPPTLVKLSGREVIGIL